MKSLGAARAGSCSGAEEGRRPATADLLDALLWLAVPALLLLLFPNGYVSNDGLGHSRGFAAGTWQLNPNHLLFEPLGAWWQGRFGGAGSLEGVDALKALSTLAGALAAAIFRLGVAPRLASSSSRWKANHATAWLALSSAFLRLWVSDEIHMIQMPFVVAAARAFLLYLERPAAWRALALGMAVGLAGLAFISNLALGAALVAALALWHLARREPRGATAATLAAGLGTVLAAGPPLLAAWLASPGAPGFLAWLTRYGGGTQGGRIESAYGLTPSLRDAGEAVVRTLYGAASAVVDLAPIAAAVRDRQAPGLAAVAGALAFLAAAAVLFSGLVLAWRERPQPASRGALLLAGSLGAAVLAFGFFWNDSDGQFFFQLAPALGALAARATARLASHRGRGSRLLLALGLAGLLWNVADVGARRILYPREERLALLEREVRGACLAVVPGFDEPELLLALSRLPGPQERQSLTDLAIRYPAPEGLLRLAGSVRGCLDAGGRVVLVDLFDTPPQRNPWKFLRRMGYERAAVERALASFPIEPVSHRVGPFTVRRAPAP